MFFLERSACIEFVDKSNVRITTPLRQREFDLEKMETEGRLFIDLVELKNLKDLKFLKFYTYLSTIDDHILEKRYILDVQARQRCVTSVEFLDGFKIAKVKIPYDE